MSRKGHANHKGSKSKITEKSTLPQNATISKATDPALSQKPFLSLSKPEAFIGGAIFIVLILMSWLLFYRAGKKKAVHSYKATEQTLHEALTKHQPFARAAIHTRTPGEFRSVEVGATIPTVNYSSAEGVEQESWMKAGMDAERVFVEQARSAGLVVESINQDKGDFFAQYQNEHGQYVKRADFIIEGLDNVRVEVKCFTVYQYSDRPCRDYFHITYSEYKGLERYGNKVKTQNIFLVIYERNKDRCKPETTRSISLSQVKKMAIYEEDKKCWLLPLENMKQGLTAIPFTQSLNR